MRLFVAILLALCWLVMGVGAARSADGYGPMDVFWRMVETQEEIAEICGFDRPSRGCHYVAENGVHVVITLPPRGTTDTDRWHVLMHELGHAKLGCYHDRYGKWIGEMHDPAVCKGRMNRR